jgi:hypothetical protein
MNNQLTNENNLLKLDIAFSSNAIRGYELVKKEAIAESNLVIG